MRCTSSTTNNSGRARRSGCRVSLVRQLLRRQKNERPESHEASSAVPHPGRLLRIERDSAQADRPQVGELIIMQAQAAAKQRPLAPVRLSPS
jgi:hypothetical protein